jgi:hypothetical protein
MQDPDHEVATGPSTVPHDQLELTASRHQGRVAPDSDLVGVQLQIPAHQGGTDADTQGGEGLAEPGWSTGFLPLARPEEHEVIEAQPAGRFEVASIESLVELVDDCEHSERIVEVGLGGVCHALMIASHVTACRSSVGGGPESRRHTRPRRCADIDRPTGADPALSLGWRIHVTRRR